MAMEQQQQQQKFQVSVCRTSKARHINAHHRHQWKECLSFAAELFFAEVKRGKGKGGKKTGQWRRSLSMEQETG
jgi:hypothetical protein